MIIEHKGFAHKTSVINYYTKPKLRIDSSLLNIISQFCIIIIDIQL